MKIVQENQNLMVVKEKNILPLVIGLIFAAVGFLIVFSPQIFKEQPPLWFGLVFILIGFLAVLLCPFVTISIDRGTGKITFLWKRLIGTKKKEYSLDQIKEIIFQTYYTIQTKTKRPRPNYSLLFIFKNEKEVAFQNKGRKDKIIGEKIAQFLNVPFQEKRPPTVSEVLSTIKETIQENIDKYKK